MNMQTLLTWIIFTPVLFAILVLLTPSHLENKLRSLALVQTLVVAAMTLVLYRHFEGGVATPQFEHLIPWLPEWGIYYRVSVDGISLPLVVLTALISPLALLGTWPNQGSLKKEKLLVIMLMMLQTGMYGTFLASDLFLFYFFWEIVLIPAFFLIGIWGGEERIAATVKFFLYTMVGSLLMLVAVFWLIKTTTETTGTPSADFAQLALLKFDFDGTSLWSALTSPQSLLFFAFALAFAIKVPMFPFHTWLPQAYVQAPMIGTIFLAAILGKFGTYGIMRIALPLFPQAAHYFSGFFLAMGVVGIIYGAFCAMGQASLKKLVAYASLSHMGFIIVGLFSFQKIALAGSLYQMVNHGLSTAGLFMVAGFLYTRLQSFNFKDYGGLAKIMPLMAVAMMLLTLSAVGIPGSNGFVGEFAILLGTFQVHPIIATLAGTGVIFGAVYTLKAYQMVMFGPQTRQDLSQLYDLKAKEIVPMLVLAFLIVGIGFFPQVFFWKSHATLVEYSNLLISTIGHP